MRIICSLDGGAHQTLSRVMKPQPTQHSMIDQSLMTSHFAKALRAEFCTLDTGSEKVSMEVLAREFNQSDLDRYSKLLDELFDIDPKDSKAIEAKIKQIDFVESDLKPRIIEAVVNNKRQEAQRAEISSKDWLSRSPMKPKQ